MATSPIPQMTSGAVFTIAVARAAHAAISIGGDAVYCAASLEIVTRLAAEGIPVISHVGLIPSKATWTGGFKAVGKTADSALKVFEHVKQLEAAGAIGAEIEVILLPRRVAAEPGPMGILPPPGVASGSNCCNSGRATALGPTRPEKNDA